MTRKADTLRPFLRCAAVVLCSLALPLVVFALWDRALLAAPHTRTDGERFSAAGRANATACTLYAAEHVTKVPLGSNSLWDAAEIGYIVPVLHNKFAYGRGINSPVINLNVGHLFHLLNIPYAAPYYRAACFGAVVQRRCKVAAQKRALVYFIPEK